MAEAGFKELIDDLQTYFDVSKTIGGAVADQADHFKNALQLELTLISKAITQKKPGDAEFQALLAPVSEAMGKVGEVESKYRGKDHINHLKAVSEGVQSLGWVCVEPTPGPFVKDTIGASQFWSNKILTQFKGKDESQVNWVTSFTGFLQNLQKYIMQYHTTGLAWNSGGGAHAAAGAVFVGGGGAGAAEAEFQDLISEHVTPYVTASEAIGGEVAAQAKLFKQAVDLELELIKKAASNKKPSQDEFQTWIAPISEVMGKIAEIESKYRGKDHINHVKTVSEGTPALGWVCVEPTPGPYVKETIGASEFWSNKILREFKGKDEKQVNWVTHFNNFLKNLVPYIMKNHATGLSFNTASGARPAAAVAVSASGSAENDFKSLIDEHLTLYFSESERIGGVVNDQAKLFKQAVELELGLISKASKSKKVSQDEFQKLLAPISEIMGKIGEVESKYRGKDHINHLKTVAEGTPALGWVCVEPTPAPYVKETIGASEFWSNKILKDFKGKDENQVNWVKGFNGFLKALVTYIMAHHTTGLSWNTVK